MDHLSFENVISLHTQDAESVSLHARSEIFATLTQEDDVILAKLEACSSDNIGGPLPLSEEQLSSDFSLPTEHFVAACSRMVDRAFRGSVALTVLEDLFSDERTANRPVFLTAFAELVDIHMDSIIDRHGLRYPLSNLDMFQLSTKHWKRTAQVKESGASGVPSEQNPALLISRSLRSVVATVYGVLCAAHESDSKVQLQPVLSTSLFVALCRTISAASQAITAVASFAFAPLCDFAPCSALILLPCGADLVVHVSTDPGEERLHVLFSAGNRGQFSGMGRITVNVLALVLMGSGVSVASEVDDIGEEHGILPEISEILWMQAAVSHRALQSHISDVPMSDITRFLTIYRVASLPQYREVTCPQLRVDEERILLAREEATELMSLVPDWIQDAYLGEGEGATSQSPEISEPSEKPQTNQTSPTAPTPSPVTPDAIIRRDEHLHFGSGSSDLTVLDKDYKSTCGIRVVARRGVVMRPDSRRSVVIRKKKALWGRVVFENDCFSFRPVLDMQRVLRALVPVQKVGAAGFSVQQFETSSNVDRRGSEVANLLLSGAFGSDCALWALKKISYCGAGLKSGFLPAYLKHMKKQISSDGFAVSCVLGSEAVQNMEVVVDDGGKVILDFEGTFKPLELTLVGRRILCTEIEDYTGGRVGTIGNKVCVY